MALVVRKLEGETWKQAALRYGAKHGLADEVGRSFDDLLAQGETEQSAAWWACTGWDVADFEDRP